MNTLRGICAALLAAVSTRASADAAPPATYWIREDVPGTVTVYLAGTSLTCPDAGQLLRKDLRTNDVVAITTCQDDHRFVDECVPAGTYQYGLATPYACSIFGTDHYAEATVAGPSGACTRTRPAPQAATQVPWGSEQTLCASTYHGPGGGDSRSGCATGGAVLATNVGLLLAGGALWRRRRGHPCA